MNKARSLKSSDSRRPTSERAASARGTPVININTGPFPFSPFFFLEIQKPCAIHRLLINRRSFDHGYRAVILPQ